jgi:anti-sigma B factor antagonist
VTAGGRPFDVFCEPREGGVVVGAGGEIDLASAPAVQEALRSAAPDGAAVVLDLRRVTFMDSSGLALIVGQHRRARETGARFAVAISAGSEVQRIIELSGIATLVTLIDDPDDFLAAA